MKTIHLILFLSITPLVFSQHGGYMNNWYFGQHDAINFDNGSPSVMTSSAMTSFEGCSTISDSDGNLLFYTNGGGINNIVGGVWNKNHEMMPNGDLDSLIGCTSSTQSSLIVKKSWHEYYLFTTGCSEVEQGLKYSIVDMNYDGGLGDVILKGIPLITAPDTLISETIGGTKHSNGQDYWVVTHGVSDNTFYVFLVTSAGISGPTAYTIGNIPFGVGELRFDMNGSQLAYSSQVFSFNNSTGAISNPISLGSTGFNKEFSPSGRYLYMNDMSGFDWGLWQYDLLALDVAGSKIQIFAHSAPYGGILLGPDAKIYVNWGNGYLDIVNAPDNGGMSCDYLDNAIHLGGYINGNLPNFISTDVNYLSNDELSMDNSPKPTLVKITDLLGRDCEFKANVPLLYIYSNGIVERKIVIE